MLLLSAGVSKRPRKATTAELLPGSRCINLIKIKRTTLPLEFSCLMSRKLIDVACPAGNKELGQCDTVRCVTCKHFAFHSVNCRH